MSAAFRRELAANRLNRFLHVHLTLSIAVGLLPMFTSTEAAGAAPWWVLQAVLYCLSLSALLLGLNSAHGEADEFPMLFSQPAPRWAWLMGKAAGLAALLAPAALLLIVPAAIAGGLTRPLLAIAAAAGGLTVTLAAVGLGLGFWVRDRVRGLLAALGTWFVLLFGTDLLLLAVAGSPWIHRHPAVWVAPLMLNPLDALRVTVLFSIENAAPAGLDSHALAGWWIPHSGLWLALLLIVWATAGLAAGLAGARRSIDA
ncbi:MAG: hypothetical protein ABI603_07095 [Acidobacteriota bacterium]